MRSEFTWKHAAWMIGAVVLFAVLLLGCAGIADSRTGRALGFSAGGMLGTQHTTTTARRYFSKVPDQEIIEIEFQANDDGNCSVPIYGMTGRLYMFTTWPDLSATPTAAWDLQLIDQTEKTDVLGGGALNRNASDWSTEPVVLQTPIPCNGLHLLNASNMGTTTIAHVRIKTGR